MIIRIFEYQADWFAVRYKKGNLLINGLSKLFKDNNGDINPDELYALFNHTHPGLVG